jgi:uncharacterized protein YjbI with pentapeptide repeats
MLGIRRREFIGARQPQKPRSTTRRQGLHKLSPDLISKARDETATQVTRIGLTFVGTAAFCLLSLLSPDSALLGGSERINVPLAGPVSFFGFMLLGPMVLIVIRVYLQIYVEHSDRLDRLARSVLVVRAPTLVPLRNSLIRLLSGLTFYLLLPVAMILFAWKAAVFPTWGSGLLCLAMGVIVSHVMLPFSILSWLSKGLLSISAAIFSAAIIAGAVMLGFEPVRRPFNLYHANLSGQWLVEYDLRGANLKYADLHDANLIGAKLIGAELHIANLSHATMHDADLTKASLFGAKLIGADLIAVDLTDADLTVADLTDADVSDADLIAADLDEAKLIGVKLIGSRLSRANLSGADLSGADLSAPPVDGARGAVLIGADLSSAKHLSQRQLDQTCGDANTKLPEGLTVKPCSTEK